MVNAFLFIGQSFCVICVKLFDFIVKYMLGSSGILGNINGLLINESHDLKVFYINVAQLI